MKKERYKIYMVDEYDGKEYHFATMFDRVYCEQLVILLNNQKEPCTSYCYYDNDGIRHTLAHFKN